MIDYPSTVQTISTSGSGDNGPLGLHVDFAITLERARAEDVLSLAMRKQYLCTGTIDTEEVIALLANDQFLLLSRCAAPGSGRELPKRSLCPRCNPLLIYRDDERSFGTADTDDGPVEMMGSVSLAFNSPFATGAALIDGTAPYSVDDLTTLRPSLAFLNKGSDGKTTPAASADLLITWDRRFETYACAAAIEYTGPDGRTWEIACNPREGYGPYPAPGIALTSEEMEAEQMAEEEAKVFLTTALAFRGFKRTGYAPTGPGSRIIWRGIYGNRDVTRDGPGVRLKSFSGQAGNRVWNDPLAPFTYRDKATVSGGGTADLFGTVTAFPDVGQPFISENGCQLMKPGDFAGDWSAGGITNSFAISWA